MAARSLSKTFRSVKTRNFNSNPKLEPPLTPLKCSIESSALPSSSTSNLACSKRSSWLVYLILSTNLPIKTYVGVTNNLSRRLKQHNGELSGGAKASRAGRPWVCACLVRGFNDKSEACSFEHRWKNFSRKLSRKKKSKMMKPADDSLPLLQHRHATLDRVKGSIDCSHLKINWQLNPF